MGRGRNAAGISGSSETVPRGIASRLGGGRDLKLVQRYQRFRPVHHGRLASYPYGDADCLQDFLTAGPDLQGIVHVEGDADLAVNGHSDPQGDEFLDLPRQGPVCHSLFVQLNSSPLTRQWSLLFLALPWSEVSMAKGHPTDSHLTIRSKNASISLQQWLRVISSCRCHQTCSSGLAAGA